MKLIFEKNNIKINNKECNLEHFNESDFFSILEQIINNRENIEIEKKDDITPLCERFYEILKSFLPFSCTHTHTYLTWKCTAWKSWV